MIVTDAERIGPWVLSRMGGLWTPGRATAIGIEGPDGELRAGVLYEDYNGASLVAHIAGEGRRWATREFLGRIFAYPFGQLGVRRITVVVPSSNTPSIRLAGRLGFTLEARLLQAHPDGDLLVFCMFRSACRYLRPPYVVD